MRWYDCVARIIEERIPQIFFNMKVKGKCPSGRPRSRWEQQVRKDVTQREGKNA
jgi:hypothetical protein